MKKLALIFVLTLSMTFIVFAEDDGHTHSGGGKSCPPGQTCLFNSDNTNESQNDFISEIFNFLTKIFE